VQDSSVATPANTAVKAGTSLGAATAGANVGKAVTLTAGAKDIYVVVEDAANNISAPLKIAAAAFIGGSVTITDFDDEYNDNYVYGFGALGGNYLFAAANTTGTLITGGKISNGEVTLNVWNATAEQAYVFTIVSVYTGNDQNVEFGFFIIENETLGPQAQPTASGTVTVSFTNGIANVAVGTLSPIDP